MTPTESSVARMFITLMTLIKNKEAAQEALLILDAFIEECKTSYLNGEDDTFLCNHLSDLRFYLKQVHKL